MTTRGEKRRIAPPIPNVGATWCWRSTPTPGRCTLRKGPVHLVEESGWASGPGKRSRYSDLLRAGRSGDRIPWGRDLPHLSRPALRPTQTPLQWVRDLSGGKVAGAWRLPPTPSSAEVKESVELYPYSPSGRSWPVLG